MSENKLFLIEDGVLKKYYGDPNAAELVIPDDVTQIGDHVFEKMGFVKVDLSNVEELGAWAFSNCRKLTEVKASEKLRRIGSYCFSDCLMLGSFTIPEGVVFIGPEAFRFVPLDEVYIPASVRSIGYRSYEARSVFRESVRITVDPENPNYHVVDGRLDAIDFHEEGGLMTVIPEMDERRMAYYVGVKGGGSLVLKKIRYPQDEKDRFKSVCDAYRYRIEAYDIYENDDMDIREEELTKIFCTQIPLEDVVIRDGEVIGFRRGMESVLLKDDFESQITIRKHHMSLSYYRSTCDEYVYSLITAEAAEEEGLECLSDD